MNASLLIFTPLYLIVCIAIRCLIICFVFTVLHHGRLANAVSDVVIMCQRLVDRMIIVLYRVAVDSLIRRSVCDYVNNTTL